LDSWVASLDAALGMASTADPAGVPAASASLAGLYDQFIYDPGHTFDQDWINGTTFLGNLTVQ
jgi:hypothetical protein